MSKWPVFLSILLNIYYSSASLLFWSSKNIDIPAVKRFTNDNLEELLIKLNKPKVYAFKGNYAPATLFSLQKENDIKYTSYVPTSDIFIENATELSGSYEDLNAKFTNTIDFTQIDANHLIMFLNTNDRHKRDADFLSTEQSPQEETAEGPVVYNTTEAIIYSAKPLLLKINATNIYLGKAYLVTANTGKRLSYKIIKANIKTDDGKLFLSFLFPYTDSYWYMTSIEIELPDGNKYNLTSKREIKAPKRFSYHCSGLTVFTDPVNKLELHFSELQLQMNVTSNKFDDAYDCVPFTTGPIWSGLFVTFILAIGLIVALNAIMSIKTMDKFDNHKTKQLTVTVFE